MVEVSDRVSLRLLRALINPCANQADLLRRECLGRRTETTGSSRPTISRPGKIAARTSSTIRTARTTRLPTGRWITVRATGRTLPCSALSNGAARPIQTTGPARSAYGRHGDVVVELRGCRDQQTLFAVAGDYDLAVFAAFEHSLEAVESQIAFLP